MRHRIGIVAAALAAVALLAGACSSSGKSTTGTTAPSSTVAPPTGKPIVIYSSIPLSGGVDLEGVKDGGAVAEAAINAAGGVKGRPIQFVACDMQLTPSGSQACGRKAVDAGAVAFLESQDAFGGAIAIASAAGIPTFSNCVCAAADATNPLSFPTVNGPVGQAAQGEIAGALGAKKVSACLFDGAAGDVIGSNVSKGLKKFNLTLNYPVKVPTSAGDLSPYVAQMAQADVVVLICAPAITVAAIRGLAQIGYKGKIVTSSALVRPQDVTALGSAAEGIYVEGGSLPASDESAPGVAQFNREYAKYGPSGGDKGGYAVETWAQLHMLANVMKTMSTIDPASLVTAMTSAGTINIPPLVPINFGQALAAVAPVRDFTSSFYVNQVKNGQFVPTSTTPYDYNNPPNSI